MGIQIFHVFTGYQLRFHTGKLDEGLLHGCKHDTLLSSPSATSSAALIPR
jgi:hypothetical protein